MSEKKRKRERKLLHAAAAGRLKKVEKVILKDLKESRSSRHQKESKKRRKWKDTKLNINCVNWEGRTPLHLACEVGSLEVARFLTDNGAIPYAVDAKGRCPLHDAARSGHADIVAFLVAAGADMEAPDELGVTPKELLAEHQARLEEKRRQAARVHYEEEVPNPSWHERLAEECGVFGNRDAFFGGWSHVEEAVAEHRAGEDFFERLAQEMLRRRRAYMEQFSRGGAPQKKRPIGPQPYASAGSTGRLSPLDDGVLHDTQRELGAEQEREACSRQEHAMAQLRQQKQRYLARWDCMADISGERDLVYDDVAFPVPEGQEAELASVLLAGVAPEEERREVKAHVVRWHPDKFGQVWGRKLAPSHARRILARVQAISQALTALYASLAPSTSSNTNKGGAAHAAAAKPG